MQATSEAGAVAALAELNKKTKYEAIARTHVFYLIAIETSGVFGRDAYEILCVLARQIKAATSNERHIPFPTNICCGAERQCSICFRVCWFRFRFSVVI